jgi:hypothetical protein
VLLKTNQSLGGIEKSVTSYMVNAEWHLDPDNCIASQHGNPSGSFSKKKKKRKKENIMFLFKKEKKRKK